MLVKLSANLARNRLVSSLPRNTIVRLNSSESSKGKELKTTTSDSTQAPVESSQNINQVPTTMVQVSGFTKYLIYKYSKKNYKSKDEVPDQVPASQLVYAKDKGRAQLTIYLIGLTILISLGVALYGKSEHAKGRRHTDDLIRQHAEYSQAHRDMLKK